MVVYESRTQWMGNLLKKLGILSVDDTNESNDSSEDDCPSSSTTKANVYDDDDSCDKYLKSLDPKDWKNQDHYKVLGLSKRRFEATDNEIKKSCKFLYCRVDTVLIF